MVYVLKSRKLRFSGVGNPVVEFPALVVASGNSLFNSNYFEVGPVEAGGGNLQMVFVLEMLSVDVDAR